jgi:maleate cis-trans isomerase
MIQYPSRGRARIGVLVPFTNVNMEADMSLLRPQGVSFHFTRMGGYDADEVPDADQMQGLGAASLEEPLALLCGARPDLVMYGCTSATLTHGTRFDRDLAGSISAMSGAKTVTAAGALVFALQFLKARNIAFASPYTADINKAAIGFLKEAGFTTVSSAGVEEDLGNYGQTEMTPDDVFELGMRADCPAAEVLVLSCTEMRSVETINRLEQAIGKPVVTSNQAMVFEAMTLLGLPMATFNHGRLFECTNPGRS